MEKNILYRYNKLPNPEHVTVLIVGAEGVGKKKLAKLIVKVETTFSMQIRLAESLPLPQESGESRPRIDFVIFMVDLTDEHSFNLARKSLQYLSVDYFIGCVCFVVTQGHEVERHMIVKETVAQLAGSYDSPVFYLDIESDDLSTARRIVSMVQIASGCMPGVSPILIDSTSIRSHENAEKM